MSTPSAGETVERQPERKPKERVVIVARNLDVLPENVLYAGSGGTGSSAPVRATRPTRTGVRARAAGAVARLRQAARGTGRR